MTTREELIGVELHRLRRVEKAAREVFDRYWPEFAAALHGMSLERTTEYLDGPLGRLKRALEDPPEREEISEAEDEAERLRDRLAQCFERCEELEREVKWYRRLRETQKAAQDLLDAARYGPGVGGGIQAPADRLRKALEEGSYDHPDAPPSRLEPPDLRW